MKKERILLYVCCLLCVTPAFSQEMPRQTLTQSSDSPSAGKYTLNALYSYTDYTFKSNVAQGSAHFNGYSNLYLGGANNFKFGKNYRSGIYIFNMDTYLNITQNPQASIREKINNNTLFAHVAKQLHAAWLVDVAGGYGQSTTHYSTYATYDPTLSVQGHAKSHGNDWFASAKLFYSHNWNKFKLISSAGFLHTQVAQYTFGYNQPNFSENLVIPRLSSASNILLEGADIYYNFSPTLHPFVSGGLLQVVNTHINSPPAATIAVGSLPNPTFSLSDNGFNIGGGLSYKYKKMTFKLAQLYYQRGAAYHSNQTILSACANMD